MKVAVGLQIMVEVEIDNKFKVLDKPYPFDDSDIPKSFYEECANSAKREVNKTYSYYKDLQVWGIYGAETSNALVELQAQATEPKRPGKVTIL